MARFPPSSGRRSRHCQLAPSRLQSTAMEREFPDTEAGRALWDFAVRLYAEPGVGDACLILQDSVGVDVPLLLWAAWLGDGADSTVLRAGDRAVGPWRARAVRPLRALRRHLRRSVARAGRQGPGRLARVGKAPRNRGGASGVRNPGRNRRAGRASGPRCVCRRVRPGTRLPRAETGRSGRAPPCMSS